MPFVWLGVVCVHGSVRVVPYLCLEVEVCVVGFFLYLMYACVFGVPWLGLHGLLQVCL